MEKAIEVFYSAIAAEIKQPFGVMRDLGQMVSLAKSMRLMK